VLQCVAVCCVSMRLTHRCVHVAVCSSVFPVFLQCVAVFGVSMHLAHSVHVAVSPKTLPVCCSVLQCVEVCCMSMRLVHRCLHVAVCCKVLPVCCSVCHVLQFVAYS